MNLIMLRDVYDKVLRGNYPNEASFRQEFLEAIKNEVMQRHGKKARGQILTATLEYLIGKRRADVRIGNVLFELEAPPRNEKNISQREREELEDKMKQLAMKTGIKLYGVVTNGWFIELYEYDEGSIRQLRMEKFLRGAEFLIDFLCTRLSKIEVIDASDFISIFGFW